MIYGMQQYWWSDVFSTGKKGISGKSADFTCSICVEFENASDNRRMGQPSSISNYPPSKRNHTSSGPLEKEVVLKRLNI
jgi:hypothetical protein